MAVAYVKDTGTKTASNFATTTGSFATLPVVGNHVMVGISDWKSSGIFGMDAVTDNQSNSYAEDFDQNSGDSARGSSSIYSCKVATSGGTYTITIDPTPDTGNFAAWGAVEFSGLDATTWKDQTGGSSADIGDALATATGANSTAAGVAIGCAKIDSGSTNLDIDSTPPTGYTNITFYNNANAIDGHSFVYKIYSASETSASQWVYDDSGQVGWRSAIVTYKAAAAAAAAARMFQRASVLGV